jgi:hypothetical protein
MGELHKRKIFSIARITCFRDHVVARKRPDLAIQRADGSPWQDPSGITGWTPSTRPTGTTTLMSPSMPQSAALARSSGTTSDFRRREIGGAVIIRQKRRTTCARMPESSPSSSSTRVRS